MPTTTRCDGSGAAGPRRLAGDDLGNWESNRNSKQEKRFNRCGGINCSQRIQPEGHFCHLRLDSDRLAARRRSLLIVHFRPQFVCVESVFKHLPGLDALTCEHIHFPAVQHIMDSATTATSEYIMSKFFGVTHQQALRVQALLRLGISEDDVRVAERLMAPKSAADRVSAVA